MAKTQATIYTFSVIYVLLCAFLASADYDGIFGLDDHQQLQFIAGDFPDWINPWREPNLAASRQFVAKYMAQKNVSIDPQSCTQCWDYCCKGGYYDDYCDYCKGNYYYECPRNPCTDDESACQNAFAISSTKECPNILTTYVSGYSLEYNSFDPNNPEVPYTYEQVLLNNIYTLPYIMNELIVSAQICSPYYADAAEVLLGVYVLQDGITELFTYTYDINPGECENIAIAVHDFDDFLVIPGGQLLYYITSDSVQCLTLDGSLTINYCGSL